MGVCCVKGSGEAEATCAELNDQGVCILPIFYIIIVADINKIRIIFFKLIKS